MPPSSADQNLVNASKPQLLSFVQSIIGYPIDAFAIVAVLETYGLRDVDVQERFGAKNIFDLAEELFQEFRKRSARYPYIPPKQGIETLSAWKRFLLFYARGLFSNAPWALQVASLLMFGYAFGVYSKFDGKQITVAGVGMMLSFLASGGFVQVLGRMASFYNGQQSYALTRQIFYRLWSLGVGGVILSAFLLDALNWFLRLFPEDSLTIGLVYYVCCGVMSLSLSLFYTLNKHIGLLVSTLIGVIVMVLLMEFSPLSMYVAHWAGFFTTSAVGLAWISWILRDLTSRMSKQQRSVHLPRFAALLPSVVPYFLAGMLYFAYLLADRLVSWSFTPQGISLKLWIHAGYEMLLIWAFAAFSLMLPMLEFIGDDFIKLQQQAQVEYSFRTRSEHNGRFVDRYMQYWLMLVALAVLVGASVYAGFSLSRDAATEIFFSKTLNAPPILARQVIVCGIIGYSLLIWGLMNTIILYSLSRPKPVIMAYLWAIPGNALVGFLLTRSFGYWYGVVGMAFGAFVFVAITTQAVMRVLREMDYHCYSA